MDWSRSRSTLIPVGCLQCCSVDYFQLEPKFLVTRWGLMQRQLFSLNWHLEATFVITSDVGLVLCRAIWWYPNYRVESSFMRVDASSDDQVVQGTEITKQLSIFIEFSQHRVILANWLFQCSKALATLALISRISSSMFLLHTYLLNTACTFIKSVVNSSSAPFAGA